MRRILVILIVIAMVIAIPVAVKFSVDLKHLRREMQAQTDTLTAARTDLKTTIDTLQVRTEQAGALEKERDSVALLLETEITQNIRLRVSAAAESRRADSLRGTVDQLSAQLADQFAALAAAGERMKDTVRNLTLTRHQLDSTTAALAAQKLFIAHVQPWYAKWKHDATQRNWLEKIFGADKAKAPAFSEPGFEAMPALPTDSIVRDTAGATQASM